MTAEVLGLDAFDDETVMERIGSILVDGNTLVFRLKDGREERRTWVKPKRTGHKHTEAEKEHMRQVMKGKWTPEKKAAVSEHMKRLRKEEPERWRKA